MTLFHLKVAVAVTPIDLNQRKNVGNSDIVAWELVEKSIIINTIEMIEIHNFRQLFIFKFQKKLCLSFLNRCAEICKNPKLSANSWTYLIIEDIDYKYIWNSFLVLFTDRCIENVCIENLDYRITYWAGFINYKT